MSHHAHYFHPDLAQHLCRDFYRNGYLHYPGFVDRVSLARLREQVEATTSRRAGQMAPEHVHRPGRHGLVLENLHFYDLFFEDLMADDRFEQLASLLLRDRVQGETVTYLHHPPLTTEGRAPQQDGASLLIAPWEALTIWVALEDMDQDTGCLHYRRGSHREGMREHVLSGQGPALAEPEEACARQQAVAFPVKAGDLLVHHCLTVHWLSPNHSYTRSLRALRLAYVAERAVVEEALPLMIA